MLWACGWREEYTNGSTPRAILECHGCIDKLTTYDSLVPYGLVQIITIIVISRLALAVTFRLGKSDPLIAYVRYVDILL